MPKLPTPEIAERPLKSTSAVLRDAEKQLQEKNREKPNAADVQVSLRIKPEYASLLDHFATHFEYGSRANAARFVLTKILDEYADAYGVRTVEDQTGEYHSDFYEL